MDKFLMELATFYGIELNSGDGCVILAKDGSERPASEADVLDVFGLSGFQSDCEEPQDWTNERKVEFTKKLQWNCLEAEKTFTQTNNLRGVA